MWEGITKNASMAQYTHVQALQLPQRSCRKLGLVEVAMMVMRIEIKTIEFWRAVISECLGTFLYVLLGCSAMLYCDGEHPAMSSRVLAASSSGQRAAGASTSGSPETDHRSSGHRVASAAAVGEYLGDGTESTQVHLAIALSFGLIMATLVQCFGHISGAHFNPVTTMAMALTCKITPLRGFFYAIAQLGGGIAGAALLYGIVPEKCRHDLGVTQVHPHLTKGQACGIELILTFILIFTIFATIDPNRKELGSKPLAIGLTVSMCHLVGYRYTSSSLNPARSLGPAFVTNRWNSHWIYWVGPFGGGITAGLLYEYIFDPSRRRKPPQAPPSVELEEVLPKRTDGSVRYSGWDTPSRDIGGRRGVRRPPDNDIYGSKEEK